ncbi:MAG: undecaprenyl/decaprenyl-phosphate alpha-N-acetylglucosaminyl 1-phosphate transferase [Candidatus Aminicenantes bacterium]|nr:MAG: undecaprenyl/decaprenyl-phosphate alpha-N-acetylglucosaminyl 1-phosphate transferase [Candidatus Aminicenantes bacterium]
MPGIITAIIISGLLSFIFSLSSAKLSSRDKFLGILKDRNSEKPEIPRIGGIVIVISLLISLLLIRVAFPGIFEAVDEKINYNWLIVAVLIIFGLGIYDDIKGADAFKKFLFQIIAAVVIFLAGFKIAEISIPIIGGKTLGFNFLSFLLTILWVVGITNAVNIIDGLDGLAVGISFFAALSLGILALISSQYLVVVFIAVLMGAMIGLYPFNFPRAKIYLGDSGSLVIGFILAALAMTTTHRKISLAIALMIPLMILFLPILETTVTIIRRIYRKQNVFKADKDHLHYRFLRKGFSETKTTLVLIFISFLFSLSGILFEFVDRKLRLFLFVLIFFICFFLLNYLGYIKINSLRAKKKEE